MKIVKNNPGENAEEDFIKDIEADDHRVLYFSEKKEAEDVIAFKEMAALPPVESPDAEKCISKPENTDTSSFPLNSEAHIISFLKGGIS